MALLAQSPAVVLTGPRQVGKTTLAHAVAEGRPSVYLDLESETDRARLAEPERFLLLGSAAIELLAPSGETLAGRVAFAELAPLDLTEVGGHRLDDLWVRGGFPDSFLAPSGEASLRWRRDFIRSPKVYVRFPLAEGVEALGLSALCGEIAAA